MKDLLSNSRAVKAGMLMRDLLFIRGEIAKWHKADFSHISILFVTIFFFLHAAKLIY